MLHRRSIGTLSCRLNPHADQLGQRRPGRDIRRPPPTPDVGPKDHEALADLYELRSRQSGSSPSTGSAQSRRAKPRPPAYGDMEAPASLEPGRIGRPVLTPVA